MTTRESEPRETQGWWTWWIVVWFLVYGLALAVSLWNTYHSTHEPGPVSIADHTFELKNQAEAWVSLGITLISVALLIYAWLRDTTAEYLDATREARVILALLLPALVMYSIVFHDDDAAKEILHAAFEVGGWVLLGGLVVGRLDVRAKRRVNRQPAAAAPQPQPDQSGAAARRVPWEWIAFIVLACAHQPHKRAGSKSAGGPLGDDNGSTATKVHAQ